MPIEAVVNAADARNLYEIPLVLHEEGLDDVVCDILRLDAGDPDLSEWEILVDRIEHVERTGAHRHHRQVREPAGRLPVGGRGARSTAASTTAASVDIEWIQAEEVEGLLADGRLRELDGIVIPGGFGERGTEGKIMAAGYAREHDIPCLGLCLGLQMMTIEYARNVLGLAGANSSELDPTTPHPVIDLMETQRGVTDMGGTMRLGAYVAQLARGLAGRPGLRQHGRLRAPPPPLRVQPQVPRPASTRASFWCSGTSPDGRLVEFIELRGHPFWVGTQAHPELKSRPTRPAPLFRELVGAGPGPRPRAAPRTSSTSTPTRPAPSISA